MKQLIKVSGNTRQEIYEKGICVPSRELRVEQCSFIFYLRKRVRTWAGIGKYF